MIARCFRTISAGSTPLWRLIVYDRLPAFQLCKHDAFADMTILQI
jgi:hypothetical protein